MLKDGKFNHIGLLDVGTFDPMDMPWDISSYTNIWTETNGLKFTFSYDSLTYNPGGKNERILKKEQIEYKYEEGQLKEKIKNYRQQHLRKHGAVGGLRRVRSSWLSLSRADS